MSNAVSKMFLYGAFVFGSHVIINELLLPSEWQANLIYFYGPAIYLLSVLVVHFTHRIHKVFPDKAGLYFAYMGVVKLLVLASAILIHSKNMQDGTNKVVIGVHIMVPALVFIVLETYLVLSLFRSNSE